MQVSVQAAFGWRDRARLIKSVIIRSRIVQPLRWTPGITVAIPGLIHASSPGRGVRPFDQARAPAPANAGRSSFHEGGRTQNRRATAPAGPHGLRAGGASYESPPYQLRPATRRFVHRVTDHRQAGLAEERRRSRSPRGGRGTLTERSSGTGRKARREVALGSRRGGVTQLGRPAGRPGSYKTRG
jgi:hypothetical protein